MAQTVYQFGNLFFTKDLVFGWVLQIEGEWAPLNDLELRTLKLLKRTSLPAYVPADFQLAVAKEIQRRQEEAAKCVEIIDTMIDLPKSKLVQPKKWVDTNRIRETVRFLCDVLETLENPRRRELSHMNLVFPQDFMLCRQIKGRFEVRFKESAQSDAAWLQVQRELTRAILTLSGGEFDLQYVAVKKRANTPEFHGIGGFEYLVIDQNHGNKVVYAETVENPAATMETAFLNVVRRIMKRWW